eukprot:TRINITY_DN4799_c0_g1_i1.p1 TRINITY_DN4799_c0_g1~~TRINITY_DN4799_c0_g1_i1.p1  ORF type:complete len:400 (+),score=53.61 TRINITY_DN4799_c0_g1_i1:105-1202(+)
MEETRNSHPYFMYDAVLAQGKAIARVVKEEDAVCSEISNQLISKGIESIHLVGIGTSNHAAQIGEFYIRKLAGYEHVHSWQSFEFCLDPPKIGPKSLVVVISHRGTKHYSLAALEHAKSSGALTVVVTRIASPVKREVCDFVLQTSENEKSSAHTVSFTSSLSALLLLSSKVGILKGVPLASETFKHLQQLPNIIEDTIHSTEPQIKKWVEVVKNASAHFFVGYGPLSTIAHEVALKIKETSYVNVEGFELEQYLHGPICATDSNVHVSFLSPSTKGIGFERTGDLVKAVNVIGATISCVGFLPVENDIVTRVTLEEVFEPFAPIIYVTILQLFTYWLALERKCNPDVFRADNPLHKQSAVHYKL